MPRAKLVAFCLFSNGDSSSERMAFVVEIRWLDAIGQAAVSRHIFHIGAVVWYNCLPIGVDFSIDCRCGIYSEGIAG